MEENKLEREISNVRLSYGRVLADPQFIDRFYQQFLKNNAEIREKFENTNFDIQNKMLGESISMAVLFSQDNKVAKSVIDRIRNSHNRHNLNIRPRLYSVWIESLIEALREFDADFDDELEQQWRKVIGKAVDYIKEGY